MIDVKCKLSEQTQLLWWASLCFVIFEMKPGVRTLDCCMYRVSWKKVSIYLKISTERASFLPNTLYLFEHWVSSWKFQQRKVWEAELTDVKIFLLKLVIKLPLIAGCKLSWNEWPKTKARTSSLISLQIMHFPSFCCCMEDTAKKCFICVWITMPGLCLFMYNGPTESKRNILWISSILELSIVSSYY